MQIEWTLNITNLISSVLSTGVAVTILLLGARMAMRNFRRQQHEIWIRNTITQDIAKLQGALNWYVTGVAAGITPGTDEEKKMLNKVARAANDYFSSVASSVLPNLQHPLTPLIFVDDLDKFSELMKEVNKVSFERVSKESFRANYIVGLGTAMLKLNLKEIIETLLEPHGIEKIENQLLSNIQAESDIHR